MGVLEEEAYFPIRTGIERCWVEEPDETHPGANPNQRQAAERHQRAHAARHSREQPLSLATFSGVRS